MSYKNLKGSAAIENILCSQMCKTIRKSHFYSFTIGNSECNMTTLWLKISVKSKNENISMFRLRKHFLFLFSIFIFNCKIALAFIPFPVFKDLYKKHWKLNINVWKQKLRDCFANKNEIWNHFIKPNKVHFLQGVLRYV